MAYNPFDDVILNDPAYMQNGGGVQPMVIPQQRPDYTQETFKPIASAISKAYQLLTPEQETLDRIERDQQLRSLATAQAFTGTDFQNYAGAFDLPSSILQDPRAMDLLNNVGFKREGFTEGLSRTGQFLYGNQRQAFDKLRDGQDLTSDDRLSIALAPLDSLDFLLPPVAIKKLAGIGLNNVNSILRSSSDLPEVQQVKQFFGGSPLPSSGIADGPPGMTRQQVSLAPADNGGSPGDKVDPRTFTLEQKEARLAERKNELNKLVKILKQNKKQDQDSSITEIVNKYGLQDLVREREKKGKNIFELRQDVQKVLNNQIPDIMRTKRDLRNVRISKSIAKETDAGIKKFLEDELAAGSTYPSFNQLEAALSAENIAGKLSITRRQKNPEFAKLIEDIIQRPEKIDTAKDRFADAFVNVPKENFFNKLQIEDFKSINKEGFDTINQLASEIGSTGTKPGRLFQSFLYDKYRSIKGSKGFEKLTEKDFFKKIKFDQKSLADMKIEFGKYVDLEADRLKMQKAGYDFLDELMENENYAKYLKNKDGLPDKLIFTANKLHDIPLFVSRTKGKGRLKKVGRFINLGTEPYFLNANFQPYNRLQVDLDPTAAKLADLLNSKTLMKKAENIKPSVNKKDKTMRGDYKIIKDRVNFISPGILEILENRGYKIDPANYTNHLSFLQDINKGLNNIYKERQIRTIIPIQKGASKEFVTYGIEDPNLVPLNEKINLFKENITDALNFAIENNITPEEFKTANGYIKFLNKGGPVRMAIGGDPLQNINQQQFTPDPAMDDDFFKKAVDSGNLQAFGAGNLFKIFGKVPGLLTPKKVVSDIPTAPGTTPMVPNVDPGDFPFKSYFIESTTNPKAPKSALPKDWLKYYTGNIGVPQSEMKDAGIFNYLEDIEKFFPNTKLTQQNLVDVYESSPIANIEVKIKRQPSTNTPPGSLGSYMGKPTHQGSGSQPLDSQGTNYREIVVNVDKLPGQDKPFFNASHFGKDPNVIAFTRVADYKDVDGNTVAAIQEIQTDMLTNLKKEQERMKATAVMIRNYKEKLKNQIAQGDTYMQDMLEKTERDYPESMLRFMETSDLVRPNNPTFADTLTPDVVKELNELQERITTIANQNRVTVVDPDFQNKIVALQEEGRQKFNKLFELNRGTNYEDQLKNIKILDVDSTDDLERFANANPSYEARFRPVQSFPVLPFNKGKDYIDLLLKATIQDAQANGINKVAIYPSELVNQRWGKDPDGPAAKKFKTIYDNITVQEMKNIAKKYTGNKNNLKIEEIVDKSKADKGLKFYNKNVDGELELLKDFEPQGGLNANDVDDFLSTEIERVALDFGPNEVVIRREIAPGQTMEYFVKTKPDDGFELVPLGDGDRAENATVIIDEYNPQRVKMFTLTLPEETTKKGPMFIYGKKDGGKIASDGLVSITDIFGEY